jgi:hypothetical protein
MIELRISITFLKPCHTRSLVLENFFLLNHHIQLMPEHINFTVIIVNIRTIFKLDQSCFFGFNELQSKPQLRLTPL